MAMEFRICMKEGTTQEDSAAKNTGTVYLLVCILVLRNTHDRSAAALHLVNTKMHKGMAIALQGIVSEHSWGPVTCLQEGFKECLGIC